LSHETATTKQALLLAVASGECHTAMADANIWTYGLGIFLQLADRLGFVQSVFTTVTQEEKLAQKLT